MVLNECVFSLNLVGLELKPSFPQLMRVTRPVSSNLCRQELSSLLRGLQRMGVPQIGLQATLHFYTDILKSDLFLGDKTRLKALCTVVTPNKLKSRKYTHTHVCAHVFTYPFTLLTACLRVHGHYTPSARPPLDARAAKRPCILCPSVP